MAFADIGDRVDGVAGGRFCRWRSAARRPAALAGLGDDNLVLRAARLYAEPPRGDRRRGAALLLDKSLPAAVGDRRRIERRGGDAARCSTTCRAARVAAAVLAELAARLGADVPACLAARPVWVGGIGERLEPADGLPQAGIVLANPRDRAADRRGVSRAARAVFGEPAGLPRCRAMPPGSPRCWRPAATI